MGTLLVPLELLLLIAVSFAQICPPGSVSSNDDSRCFTFMAPKTDFITADRTCRGIGGNLASILTDDDQKAISELLRGERQRGANVWIGGNDMFHYGNWSWTDGSPFKFLSQPMPPAAGNCLSLVATTKWTKVECCSEKSFVCATESSKPITCPVVPQTPKPSAPPTSMTATLPFSSCPKSNCISDCKCPDGWSLFTETNMCYLFSDLLYLDWSTSEKYCQHFTGHLVSINSQSEQHFLNKLINSASNHSQPPYGSFKDIWIGLSNTSPMFAWSDGCPVDYSNWDVNEPSGDEKKHCVQMSSGNTAGTWSTVSCSGGRKFVCKAQPV
ncbi:hypothetical protein L596_010523 [Steinernema carpocapsae]|uniref:C-type lectin domain-containing protein n=1 Tax=Steinernema carpocapsae TaxID=34508 RepID=A0A4U5PIT6_STECR|nr:hypothetical protein L596_010523 [Steinernema carpocapsae]